ncbi:MAGUK p55 subfamily member 7-like isoform X2 [Varroa jacobsoni]|uniref:MAGUK p55 subfamily member 7-like isoform X2 n=1 Tax=Varroa jacobsoni TaxID=62625 RepID=UPI000BF5AB86|nr:MAGUK p55 subfamily member 7-like isoform X2 [Varroa jacobsoni]
MSKQMFMEYCCFCKSAYCFHRSPLLPRGGWHEADWDGVENGQNRGQVVGTPTSPGGDKKNREKSTEGRAGKRAAGATMAIEHFIDRYRQKKTNGEEDHNGEDANRSEGHLSENIPDKTWKVILSLEECKLLRQVANISTPPEDEAILLDPKLNALFSIQKRFSKLEPEEREPRSKHAVKKAEEVKDFIGAYQAYHDDDAAQLFAILNKPHVKALLEAHDSIARRDYEPPLPSPSIDFDEEVVKVVQLVKGAEPLGITVKFDPLNGAVKVHRVLHGGAADRSGLIQPDDEIIEINGIDVEGRTAAQVDEVFELVRNSPNCIVKLLPAGGPPPLRATHVNPFHLRALFDYDPFRDPRNECPDAGLAFRKGDILHVIAQDDMYWWQARIGDEETVRVGLIPTPLLQERRFAAQRELTTLKRRRAIKSPILGARKIRKVKKTMYRLEDSDSFDHEHISTYEEVSLLMSSQINFMRPVVLIGPPGVGRNELKRRLIATNPNLFRTTVPHTSRPQRIYEVNGRDYHFISRQRMEWEIRKGRFMEHGEFAGNLYGTSLDSLRALMATGYTAVLTPHLHALKLLRSSELKPHVVFIKPPPFEILKETRLRTHARSPFDPDRNRGFTDDELRNIIFLAHKMEYLYGQWFDDVIVNEDIEHSFLTLLAIWHSVQTQPKWVPISWTQLM